jgi:hypothetical protein
LGLLFDFGFSQSNFLLLLIGSLFGLCNLHKLLINFLLGLQLLFCFLLGLPLRFLG